MFRSPLKRLTNAAELISGALAVVLWTYYSTIPAVHGDVARCLSPSMVPAAIDKRLPRDPELRWAHCPQVDVAALEFGRWRQVMLGGGCAHRDCGLEA